MQGSAVEAVPDPSSGRAAPKRAARRFHSLFCSHFLPRQPGHSGGEIRDFHLIRHLLSFSTVGYFAVYDAEGDNREDVLASLVDYPHGPAEIRAARPDLIDLDTLRRPILGRAANLLRRCRIPVLGPQYHLDVAAQMPSMQAFLRGAVQEALLHHEADFLFVSPQTNPLALLLARRSANTRLVMASYDVERVRMRRIASSQHGVTGLAARLEARRAARFERHNLACYDAVIAVSDVDRQLFIDGYGLSPKRVLTVENSVDADYFSFTPRRTSGDPHIVFVASFAYLPNRQAAWRLLQEIMPRVRQTYPQARLSLVGQSPPAEMRELHDGATTVITGTVDDVRPYLARATVACVPLSSGSGTKYKVLEALSAGVPMVCSPLALEGLELEEGKHALAAEDDDGLAAAIIRLHQDPGLASAFAREGRQRIEARYTWAANLSRLEGWLATVAALPKRGLEPDMSSATLPSHRADIVTGGE